MFSKFREKSGQPPKWSIRKRNIPIYLLLFFILFAASSFAQVFDERFYVDIPDVSGLPGDTVEIPISIRIPLPVGGFLIRFIYDTRTNATGILHPFELDNCPNDTCIGYCCDPVPTDTCPGWDCEDLPTYLYDSVAMVGPGVRTIYIDSSGLPDQGCAHSYLTRYHYNVFAIHHPFDDSMHVNTMFLHFIPPFSPSDECELQYWTRPIIDTSGSNIENVTTAVARILFTVDENATMGEQVILDVKDYDLPFPPTDYRDNQFSDSSGEHVFRPTPSNLGSAIFTVEQGTGGFNPDTCAVAGSICKGSYGQDTCCVPGGTNTPPTIAQIVPSTYDIDQGETVSFGVSASDADGDQISLLASQMPSGASFSPSNPVTGTGSASGTFSWTPSFAQSGSFTIIFTVTDDQNASSSRTVSINVNVLNVDRLFTTSAYGASPCGGIPGATPVIMPVNMVSTRTVYGIQYDMIYPDDIFEIDSIVVTDLTPEYVVYENIGDYPDSIRVIAFGLENEPIGQGGATQAILNTYLAIDSTAIADDYWVNFRNAWESIDPDPSVPSLELVADSGIVQIDRMGDVNLDKQINVADVVNVVGYIIGNFGLVKRNFETADVIQDAVVNVVDLIGIINLIFGNPVDFNPNMSTDYGGQIARLEIEHDNLVANQLTKLNVRGEFPDNVAGVQLQIDYDPTVIELDKPELAEVTGGFTLAYKDDKSGRMRVLLYTFEPWREEGLIPAGASEILRLPALIKEDISADDAKVRITQAYLSNSRAGQIPTEEPDPLLPTTFMLYQNYPNPFNPVTKIDFDIESGGSNGMRKVKLDVYNILGRKVKTLIDDYVIPGRHTVEWNGTDSQNNRVATGIYLYRLEVENRHQTKKMLLLK